MGSTKIRIPFKEVVAPQNKIKKPPKSNLKTPQKPSKSNPKQSQLQNELPTDSINMQLYLENAIYTLENEENDDFINTFDAESAIENDTNEINAQDTIDRDASTNSNLDQAGSNEPVIETTHQNETVDDLNINYSCANYQQNPTLIVSECEYEYIILILFTKIIYIHNYHCLSFRYAVATLCTHLTFCIVMMKVQEGI